MIFFIVGILYHPVQYDDTITVKAGIAFSHFFYAELGSVFWSVIIDGVGYIGKHIFPQVGFGIGVAAHVIILHEVHIRT